MAPDKIKTTRPFSLRLIPISDFHLLILGYFDGSIHLYTISSTEGTQLRATVQGSGERGSGISIMDVLYQDGKRSALLLTGTIDGRLSIYTISLTQSDNKTMCSVEFCVSYIMGLTRVSIKSDCGDGNGHRSAFITGDRRLAKIGLVGTDVQPDFTFDEIWVTDRSNMAAPQGPIRAVCRIPQLKSSDTSEWSGNVLFGGSEELISTNLIQQRQMIPLCYSEFGQARHFEFSSFFRKIVVAADSIRSKDAIIEQQPALHLISPDTSHFNENPADAIRFGALNDKVKALLNWSPSNGRTHYNLVVVALSNGRDSVVGHLSAKKLISHHDGDASFKVVLKLPRLEVNALCEFGTSSLIVAAGNQLVLLHLEIDAKKWSQQAKYDLPSAALSLSAKGQFVYAATSKHSMMVFRVEDNQFKIAFADKSAKNVRHVVPFSSNGRHVLVSALNGVGSSIYGYMQGSSISDNPSPSFEAQTPLPVEQIIPIRTNWSHREHHGFQATTIDGTVYHFKTLTFDEYKMLRFMERIARPDVTKPAKKRMTLLTKQMSRTYVSRLEAGGISTFDPKSMHINGDVIERLLEKSSHDLRMLLEPDVKNEDDMVVDSEKDRKPRFLVLAARVVGENADQVEAVMGWARRLLRSSIV